MKMKWNNFILFATLLVCASCHMPEDYSWSADQVMQVGDSMAWSQPAYVDSLWTKYTDFNSDEVFWVRLPIDLPQSDRAYEDLGILIGAFGSYDAYWDGEYIGTNGRLSSRGIEEIPGTYHYFKALPKNRMQAGRHVLAMRTSMSKSEVYQQSFAIVGDYQDLLRKPLQVSKYMFLLAGAFLIIAIYFFFLFINAKRDYALLIFTIICLSFFALILMEYLKLFYLYEYPFQLTRLQIIDWLHIALTALIPLTFLIQFSIPYKKLIMAVVVLTIIVIEYIFYAHFDTVAIVLNIATWVYSVFIVSYAIYLKRKDSLIALAALILSISVIYFMPAFRSLHASPFDLSLFIAFIIIIISMLYLHSIKRKDERLAYEHALVQSERLKNELLKKNIKPHFIMNTLTSLIDWVEESPKKGVEFIQALAGEFEVLNDIADKQLIPIGQEINLCKRHLDIMGFRKEIDYIWEEHNIDFNEIIPPAVIHTAVENGVSHSLPDEQGQIKFILKFKQDTGTKIYSLRTVAKTRQKNNMKKVEDGTGLKYIKARLQESYPDNWTLNSQATADGWEVIMKIKSA